MAQQGGAGEEEGGPKPCDGWGFFTDGLFFYHNTKNDLKMLCVPQGAVVVWVSG